MGISGIHIPFTDNLTAHTMVMITDKGSRAANSLQASGANFNILVEIDQNKGSMTVLQIARAVDLKDNDDLKRRLKALKSAGMVRFGGES